MKHALLLFLSSNHLQARWLENGKTIAEGDFPDSADGKANFSTFLKGKKCATYLLVDVIEEDFRQETIPHLIGGTRNALLKRKFEQFYRDTPFQQATFLQRQSNGRRDDEMLFSALTNPSAITPWVDIMLTYKTPLIGIYSVPQVSTPLVKNHISKHLLLISWERSAGLRQSYFRDHRLNISRLTPLRGETTFQDAVLDELGRTYQYLKNLSLLPAGQTLDVRIMGAVNDLVELQQKLPRSADMRYDFADLEDIAKQLKFNDTVTDSDASLLFMHQLLATPPKSSYANSSHTHFYDLWKLRRPASPPPRRSPSAPSRTTASAARPVIRAPATAAPAAPPAGTAGHASRAPRPAVSSAATVSASPARNATTGTPQPATAARPAAWSKAGSPVPAISPTPAPRT